MVIPHSPHDRHDISVSAHVHDHLLTHTGPILIKYQHHVFDVIS